MISAGIRIAGEPITSPPSKNARGSKFVLEFFRSFVNNRRIVQECDDGKVNNSGEVEEYGEKDAMKITNTSASVIKYFFSKDFPRPHETTLSVETSSHIVHHTPCFSSNNQLYYSRY